MKCKLMHKRTAVADIEIDEVYGGIQSIGTVYNPEHLPVGVALHGGIIDRASLNEWWCDRSIPASRSGIETALVTLGVGSTMLLLTRSLGLSLSDQYWICPVDTQLEWDDVNFFENAFSDDIGDILFGAGKKGIALDFSSPDSTSDGNLQKRWKIIDGKRCLIKGGSAPFRQQPFNEVIASGIMERLGIPHIPYSVIWSDGAPYSICEDFVTKESELVPAWRIIKSRKKDNSTSMYMHFVNCCDSLGVKDAVLFLERMITLDYIIANEDRHFNNFGLLRDAETLRWLGIAPIYDSGTSLGYNKMIFEMRSERDVVCKPFKNKHMEQLKLVSSFDWIDFDKLRDVREFILDVLSSAGEYSDVSRAEAVTDGVERRIRNVRSLAMGRRKEETEADTLSTEDDVERDVAEDYTQNF